MLKILRKAIIDHIWQKYCASNPQMRQIEQHLRTKNINHLPQDHFALIDLPSDESGIPVLKKIFEMLGYQYRGQGYLSAKQNDFLWLSESETHTLLAGDALPQAVVADFRLGEMPSTISTIISKYANQTKAFPFDQANKLIARVNKNDEMAMKELFSMITDYLKGRDWPLPTTADFLAIKEYNELLAWVLVFGRQANHFTFSVHLLNAFTSMAHFNHYVENTVGLQLNQEGGVIKGSDHVGLEQSSTMGIPQLIRLADGDVELPLGFVEFVWRFPVNGLGREPIYWNDYFNDFIPQHADSVIESLYTETNMPTS